MRYVANRCVGQADAITSAPAAGRMHYTLALSVQSGCKIPRDGVAMVASSGLISTVTIDIREGKSAIVPPFVASGLHGERALVYAHDDGTSLEQYTYHYRVDSPRLL